MTFIKQISQEPVKVFWWRYNFPKELNFGDEITPLLVRTIFKRRVIWKDPSECDVAGIGSIIQGVSDRSGGQHPVSIWGSGFIEGLPRRDFPNLTFYAVRGKLSLSQIKNAPAEIALGDPALLLPLALKTKRTKKYKIGIIPHYVDAASPKLDRFRNNPDVLFIDVLQPVKKVIAQINTCELILSSSLHGLIVSDAYNIPNVWVPLSDQVYGGSYKFDDYYSVFDRTSQPHDIENITIVTADGIIANYTPITSRLGKVQAELVHAFNQINV